MTKTALYLGTPSERQLEFLRARTRYVGFGGARGGGKSWAVRTKAVLLCLRYPGIRTLIVRRTYPELVGNHITALRALLADVAVYNDKDKVIRFACGSTIHFSYCANDGDLDRLQGVEYDVIFIDEATQLSEFQLRTVCACVRGVNSFPKRVYYTCNPGGKGHAYIKRIFIDKRYEAGEHPEDYTFIRSLVTDNKALMESQPDYIRQLEALPPRLRKAWLEGRWDVFEGQFFEDFRDVPEHYADRQWTHVIEPFEPPASWKIYRSFDFGYSKPFSCAWWAVDYDGRLYRILELYGCGNEPNVGVRWTPDRIFREIAQTEKTHPWLAGKHVTGIADPAIWDASHGESIAESAARCGVLFTPGDNSRLAGWMQFHYRLQFDGSGIPMMYVFKNCTAFIRTVPLLEYDTEKCEDLDTDGEDHVADEVRYLCMARPLKPKPAPADDGYALSPAALYMNVPRENVRRAAYVPKMEIIK